MFIKWIIIELKSMTRQEDQKTGLLLSFSYGALLFKGTQQL